MRTILPLPNGVPSHDTFSRVLAHLKTAELQKGFLDWFTAIATATKGELVALEGKTLRKSAAKAWGQAAVQMVSAWASENRLILGQEKVDPASNEMTAVPALLEKLALNGCIVTVDALHYQVKKAGRIVKGAADYVIVAKGNQQALHDAIQHAFAEVQATNFVGRMHDISDRGDPAWPVGTPNLLDVDGARHLGQGQPYWSLAEAGLYWHGARRAPDERQDERRGALLHQQSGRECA